MVQQTHMSKFETNFWYVMILGVDRLFQYQNKEVHFLNGLPLEDGVNQLFEFSCQVPKVGKLVSTYRFIFE